MVDRRTGSAPENAVPVGRCVRGRRPLRHRRNHLRCPHWRSRPFTWSGRRRIDGAIRCRQLWAIALRRTSRPTPFQRRGCELPLDLLGPRGAFTEPSRPSDALSVTRGHARPASVPTDALSVPRSLRMVKTATEPPSRRTLRRMTGEGHTGKSPRTPSVVSRTCEPKPTSRTSAY
jgi:hypothetical protein